MISGRFRGYLILGAVFLSGAVMGASAAYAHGESRIADYLAEPRAEGRDRRFLQAFARELDLDDAQQERVRTIVDRHRPERERHLREMLERCGQPLAKHKEAVDREIRQVLRPEQIRRFDELRAQHSKFLKHGSPD